MTLAGERRLIGAPRRASARRTGVLNGGRLAWPDVLSEGSHPQRRQTPIVPAGATAYGVVGTAESLSRARNRRDGGQREGLMHDDARTVLLVAAETLRERGRRVVCSSVGREAIADGLSHRPDLILLDILAGPTTGSQACRVVQKPGDARCIPINVITAATRPLALLPMPARMDARRTAR